MQEAVEMQGQHTEAIVDSLGRAVEVGFSDEAFQGGHPGPALGGRKCIVISLLTGMAMFHTGRQDSGIWSRCSNRFSGVYRYLVPGISITPGGGPEAGIWDDHSPACRSFGMASRHAGEEAEG